jgi:hypothetical protein
MFPTVLLRIIILGGFLVLYIRFVVIGTDTVISGALIKFQARYVVNFKNRV